MNFLLTRPREDSEKLATQLKQLGHTAYIDPLINIRSLPLAAREHPADYQALVFTSANGVRAFSRHFTETNMPVVAVGDATARTAAAAGFSRITASGGTVEKLAETIKQHLNPDAGPLLHVAGTIVAGDLKALVAEAGFRLERWSLYHAEAATKLDPATLRALEEHQIDIIPLYSPRTARIFAQLIRQTGHETTLRHVSALCLSPAVRNMIQSLHWRRCLVARTPTQDSLFETLNIRLPDMEDGSHETTPPGGRQDNKEDTSP